MALLAVQNEKTSSIQCQGWWAIMQRGPLSSLRVSLVVAVHFSWKTCWSQRSPPCFHSHVAIQNDRESKAWWLPAGITFSALLSIRQRRIRPHQVSYYILLWFLHLHLIHFNGCLRYWLCCVQQVLWAYTSHVQGKWEPKAITALIPRLLSVLEQVPAECNFFLAQGLTSWEQNQMLSDCKTIDFSSYNVINAI